MSIEQGPERLSSMRRIERGPEAPPTPTSEVELEERIGTTLSIHTVALRLGITREELLRMSADKEVILLSDGLELFLPENHLVQNEDDTWFVLPGLSDALKALSADERNVWDVAADLIEPIEELDGASMLDYLKEKHERQSHGEA